MSLLVWLNPAVSRKNDATYGCRYIMVDFNAVSLTAPHAFDTTPVVENAVLTALHVFGPMLLIKQAVAVRSYLRCGSGLLANCVLTTRSQGSPVELETGDNFISYCQHNQHKHTNSPFPFPAGLGPSVAKMSRVPNRCVLVTNTLVPNEIPFSEKLIARNAVF